jgi:GWxTD domain-containing protein
VYPNPGRRYGRVDSDVKVYLEGHLPQGQDRARLRLVWEVLDVRGRRLMLLLDSLAATQDFDRAQVLRLQALKAGRYHLRLAVEAPGGARRSVQGDFDMAWAPGAVLDRNVVALTDEARVLFVNEELDKFLDLSPGEQENYWNEYWNDINQSPDAPEGDARLEFESRIQYANENFGGKEAGMLTDRGRIFVRYGPPDELTQSVMPVGGESLTDLGDQIGLEGSLGADLLKKQGASGAGDTRPYEIWDYDLHDRTIFGKHSHPRSGPRIRFVFVDELGLGDYVLKYSSE